jgi:hypothetical protein
MVFSLKKTTIIKRIPFILPTPNPLNLKEKKTNKKKSPYSNEKLKKKKKNPLHYLFVQLQKKEEKNSKKVTNFERIIKKNMTTLY